MSSTGIPDPSTTDTSTAPPTSTTNYAATQAATPSFLTTLETYADPTQHPMFLVIAGLALVALVVMPGKKKSSGFGSRNAKSGSARNVMIFE